MENEDPLKMGIVKSFQGMKRKSLYDFIIQVVIPFIKSRKLNSPIFQQYLIKAYLK
jgi:hypothetical protein